MSYFYILYIRHWGVLNHVLLHVFDIHILLLLLHLLPIAAAKHVFLCNIIGPMLHSSPSLLSNTKEYLSWISQQL